MVIFDGTSFIFLRSKANKPKIIAISNDQIKSISSDFCSFYSSCEQCLKLNVQSDVFNEFCSWDNKCVSVLLNDRYSYNYTNEINKCSSKFEFSTSITKNSNDYILMIRNISSSKNDNFETKNNSIQSERIQIFDQKQNVFFIYIFVVLGIVISVLLIVILLILILRKRNSKIFKNIRKNLKNRQNKNKSKNNNSVQYIDNIYSYVNTNRRNQNVYQNNILNVDTVNNRIQNNFNQTFSSESDESPSTNINSRLHSKPIHSIQDPSSYIIDYSLISTSLSGHMLDIEQPGNYPINNHFPFINLSQPIKLPNGMETSVIYQEAPSIIIASDDGDQCLENNYMLTIDKKENEYNANNSSVYSRNTLF